MDMKQVKAQLLTQTCDWNSLTPAHTPPDNKRSSLFCSCVALTSSNLNYPNYKRMNA